MTLQNWDLTLFDSEIISPIIQPELYSQRNKTEKKAPTIAPMNGYTRWGGRVSLTLQTTSSTVISKMVIKHFY